MHLNKCNRIVNSWLIRIIQLHFARSIKKFWKCWPRGPWIADRHLFHITTFLVFVIVSHCICNNLFIFSNKQLLAVIMFVPDSLLVFSYSCLIYNVYHAAKLKCHQPHPCAHYIQNICNRPLQYQRKHFEIILSNYLKRQTCGRLPWYDKWICHLFWCLIKK